ncbi:hypothetical protein PCE1_002017 [Barthelona sp. PCE]
MNFDPFGEYGTFSMGNEQVLQAPVPITHTYSTFSSSTEDSGVLVSISAAVHHQNVLLGEESGSPSHKMFNSVAHSLGLHLLEEAGFEHPFGDIQFLSPTARVRAGYTTIVFGTQNVTNSNENAVFCLRFDSNLRCIDYKIIRVTGAVFAAQFIRTNFSSSVMLGINCQIYVMDLNEMILTPLCIEYSEPIRLIEPSPFDNNLFAVGSYDKSVVVFNYAKLKEDTESANSTSKILTVTLQGAVSAIAWNPDDTICATTDEGFVHKFSLKNYCQHTSCHVNVRDLYAMCRLNSDFILLGHTKGDGVISKFTFPNIFESILHLKDKFLFDIRMFKHDGEDYLLVVGMMIHIFKVDNGMKLNHCFTLGNTELLPIEVAIIPNTGIIFVLREDGQLNVLDFNVQVDEMENEAFNEPSTNVFDFDSKRSMEPAPYGGGIGNFDNIASEYFFS